MITCLIGLFLPLVVLELNLLRQDVAGAAVKPLLVRVVILDAVIHALPQEVFGLLVGLFIGLAAEKSPAVRWSRVAGWLVATLAFTPASVFLWIAGTNDLIYTWTTPQPPVCGQPFFGFLVFAIASHGLSIAGYLFGWGLVRLLFWVKSLGERV